MGEEPESTAGSPFFFVPFTFHVRVEGQARDRGMKHQEALLFVPSPYDLPPEHRGQLIVIYAPPKLVRALRLRSLTRFAVCPLCGGRD